jgi:hypothetical protein
MFDSFFYWRIGYDVMTSFLASCRYTTLHYTTLHYTTLHTYTLSYTLTHSPHIKEKKHHKKKEEEIKNGGNTCK